MIRAALRGPARAVRKAVLPRLIPASKGGRIGKIDAIRVVGLLSSATGLGKSARLCAQALVADGLPVRSQDVSDLFAVSDGLAYAGQTPERSWTPRVSIYHLNPPKLLPGLLRAGIGRYRGSYNIGYWAWELESLPREWLDGLRFVDAVMVPSTFCRDAIARTTTKPVLVVPHPVQLDDGGAPNQAAAAATFRVLNIFSFDSSFERKNPIALVRAFKQAFGDDPSAELILKSTGAARYPAEKDKLMREVGGSPNIKLKDELWSQAALDAEFASIHVYASLHRSEGFGLTLAEAALMNIPLVTTNWSGNTDFCPPDLSFPVQYKLIPVQDDHPDLSGVTGATWAEPSVDSAAAQLRAVRASPTEARNKAEALRAALLSYLSTHTYKAALTRLSEADA